MTGRSRWRGLALSMALGFSVLGMARPASADAVDNAFAAGTAAAAEGDWSTAVQSFERASSLAQKPSAALSFNLGTAYLHTGDLGRATFHLRRSLHHTSAPSGEVMERATYNLQVARRRAELQAAATGAKIDRPETWWDLVLEVLRAQGIAWLSLLSGWAGLVVLVLHVRRIRRGIGSTSVTRAMLIVLGLVFVSFGSLHGLAARADRTSPQAVVLEPQLDARDGPGNHRTVQFSLQAGSRVRIVDQAPGWRRVRLPGGIEGWVPEKSASRRDRAVCGARDPHERRRRPLVARHHDAGVECIVHEPSQRWTRKTRIALRVAPRNPPRTRRELVEKSQALLPGAKVSPHRAPFNLVWHPTTYRDKLSARVLSVVATKIRSSQGTGSLTATAGRIYEGYLLSEPLVGRGMVIFRDPNGRRMVTTAVRRVLTTGEDNVLYVETENSVYRIAIRDEHFTAAAIA